MTTLRSPMHSSRWWAVAATTTCLFRSSILGAGQAAKDQPTADVKKLALFDGKSLDGWKKTEFPSPGEVKVEGGEIDLECRRHDDRRHAARQDLPRVDFELSYEARRPPAATSSPRRRSRWARRTSRSSMAVGAATSPGSRASTGWTPRRTRRSLDQVRGQDLVSVPDGDGRGDPLLGRRQGGRRRRLTGPSGRHAASRSRVSEPLGFATWKTGGALRKVAIRALSPDEVAAANKSVR